MDYYGVKDTAERWGVSKRQVQSLCDAGRVNGAFRVGTVWVIPAEAEKPIDRRTTEGKKERDKKATGKKEHSK